MNRQRQRARESEVGNGPGEGRHKCADTAGMARATLLGWCFTWLDFQLHLLFLDVRICVAPGSLLEPSRTPCTSSTGPQRCRDGSGLSCPKPARKPPQTPSTQRGHEGPDDTACNTHHHHHSNPDKTTDQNKNKYCAGSPPIMHPGPAPAP